MRRLLWFSVGFAAACLAGAVFYGAWLIFGATITLLAAGILAAVYKKYGHCMRPILILLGMATGLCWFGGAQSHSAEFAYPMCISENPFPWPA